MANHSERTAAHRARRTVYLPADINAWLAEQAKARGFTVSEWLVRAIDEVRGKRLLSDGAADRLRQGGN